MEDFSSTVEHLELPRQHVPFDRNRKRAKPCKKGRESFDLLLQSLSVSGTCSFCTFLIIKVFESTLLRLPCSPGKYEMSRHCREDDDDGGGPLLLPKSLENRSTTAPLVGIPGRPCLRWTSRNVFFVTQRKKNEKLLKPRGIYPLYLGVFPNDSAQRCSNINEERRRVLLEIDQLHAKEVMYHASSCDKVHQPQVPGLRCHCQQGECQKSF